MRPLAVAASRTYHNAVDVDSNAERIDPVEVDTNGCFLRRAVALRDSSN